MHKGESIISIAITAILVLIVLAIQKQWSPATFESMASSAEDFVLTTTGLKGRIPDLPGYERVKTFSLGSYRAALYRAVPAPLIFAKYRFLIFHSNGHALFSVDSVEASTTPWTKLYDFAGTHGSPNPRTGGYPVYSRDLTGDGRPDVLLGQYSGGDRCCTTVTVLEIGQDKVSAIAEIRGVDGMPFEGLEIRSLARGRGRQLVVHRPYQTVCGAHADAADVIAIYGFENGKFVPETSRFSFYLGQVLQQDLAKWKQPRNRSLHLLQTLATDYAASGQASAGEQFFQTNLPLFSAQLQSNGVAPETCTQNLAALVGSLFPASPHT
jgi:hypothetical protein